MATKLPDAHVSTTDAHSTPDSGAVSDADEKSPRLPHERDESFDSQEEGSNEPRAEIMQAFKDIESGQMDTDRRGIRGVEEVHRNGPQNVQENIPASSRIPPSVPKK